MPRSSNSVASRKRRKEIQKWSFTIITKHAEAVQQITENSKTKKTFLGSVGKDETW